MKSNFSFRRLSAELLERRQLFSADLSFEPTELPHHFLDSMEFRSNNSLIGSDAHRGPGVRGKEPLANTEQIRQGKNWDEEYRRNTSAPSGRTVDDSQQDQRRRDDRDFAFRSRRDREPSGEFVPTVAPVQRTVSPVIAQPLSRPLGNSVDVSRERPVELAVVVSRSNLLLEPTAASFVAGPRNISVSIVVQNNSSLSIRSAVSSESPASSLNLRKQDIYFGSIPPQDSRNQFSEQSFAASETGERISNLSRSTKATEAELLSLGRIWQWAGSDHLEPAKSSHYAVEENERLIELSKHSLVLLSQALKSSDEAKEWRLDQKTLKNLSTLANQRQGYSHLRQTLGRSDSVIASWFNSEKGLIEIAESYYPVSIQPASSNDVQVAIKLDSILGLHRMVESLEEVDESESWLTETNSQRAVAADLVFENRVDDVPPDWSREDTEVSTDVEKGSSATSSVFLTTLLTLFSFQRITKKRKIQQVK